MSDITHLQAVQRKAVRTVAVSMLNRLAYREAYRRGEVARETAAAEDMLVMPADMILILDSLPDEADQAEFNAAWIDGATDAYLDHEPLTDQQIDIHYD